MEEETWTETVCFPKYVWRVETERVIKMARERESEGTQLISFAIWTGNQEEDLVLIVGIWQHHQWQCPLCSLTMHPFPYTVAHGLFSSMHLSHLNFCSSASCVNWIWNSGSSFNNNGGCPYKSKSGPQLWNLISLKSKLYQYL